MAGRRTRQGAGPALRTRRQDMLREGAILAGDPHCHAIVYGYGFPSCPGRIKIGYSSRGLARVAEQSTGFPEKPVLHFVIHDPKAKFLEAAFHAALADRQSDTMGVEWFNVSVEECISVSPALRRASGRRAAAMRRRLALYAGLAILSALLYAPLAATSLVAFGEAARSIPDLWSGWAGALSEGHLLDLLGASRRLAGRVLESELPLLAKAAPAVAAALPLFAPLLFGRRQVR